MDSITSWIGLIAATCTSLSYIPQIRKALPRGSTSDLSLKMLAVLTSGLAMWVVYGVLKSDWVIIVTPLAPALAERSSSANSAICVPPAMRPPSR